MALRINDTAPDFTADTTEGEINFHEWIVWVPKIMSGLVRRHVCIR